MNWKTFLESITQNTHHTINSVAEMLDIEPQELMVEEFSDRAKQALLKLFNFLEEYRLISDGCLIKTKFN